MEILTFGLWYMLQIFFSKLSVLFRFYALLLLLLLFWSWSNFNFHLVKCISLLLLLTFIHSYKVLTLRLERNSLLFLLIPIRFLFLHSNLYFIWNLVLWKMRYGSDCFYSNGYPVVTILIINISSFAPVIWDSLSIWVHFWAFYSFPRIGLSIHITEDTVLIVEAL